MGFSCGLVILFGWGMVDGRLGLRAYSRLWGLDFVKLMFNIFVEGKKGREEQVMPSVAQFQG